MLYLVNDFSRKIDSSVSFSDVDFMMNRIPMNDIAILMKENWEIKDQIFDSISELQNSKNNFQGDWYSNLLSIKSCIGDYLLFACENKIIWRKDRQAHARLFLYDLSLGFVLDCIANWDEWDGYYYSRKGFMNEKIDEMKDIWNNSGAHYAVDFIEEVISNNILGKSEWRDKVLKYYRSGGISPDRIKAVSNGSSNFKQLVVSIWNNLKEIANKFKNTAEKIFTSIRDFFLGEVEWTWSGFAKGVWDSIVSIWYWVSDRFGNLKKLRNTFYIMFVEIKRYIVEYNIYCHIYNEKYRDLIDWAGGKVLRRICIQIVYSLINAVTSFIGVLKAFAEQIAGAFGIGAIVGTVIGIFEKLASVGKNIISSGYSMFKAGKGAWKYFVSTKGVNRSKYAIMLSGLYFSGDDGAFDIVNNIIYINETPSDKIYKIKLSIFKEGLKEYKEIVDTQFDVDISEEGKSNGFSNKVSRYALEQRINQITASRSSLEKYLFERFSSVGDKNTGGIRVFMENSLGIKEGYSELTKKEEGKDDKKKESSIDFSHELFREAAFGAS